MNDLGTLGGPNSAADGPNAAGEAVVVSESAQMDPNGEDFCEFGTHHQCLGAIWKNGILTALPTLRGGNNASAFGVNNPGQVVGFAENGVRDTTCLTGGTPFQVIRFEPVMWSRNGEIQALPLLKGDTVGFAFGINDPGQIVGSSGLCSNTAIPPNPNGSHAVLWDRGFPIDLGNLGGTMFNVATSINNQGEVVGTSQYTDGTIHSFLWIRGAGMRDLGTLPGAVVTVAGCCRTINERGEVVGFSIDGGTGKMTAFLWQNNVILDLNQLIPAGSPWYLQSAQSINDRGEIVGAGLINGSSHAFLAIPQ